MKDRTEAVIIGAQTKPFRTRSTQAGVYHTRQDPKCRDGPAQNSRVANQPDIVLINKQHTHNTHTHTHILA